MTEPKFTPGPWYTGAQNDAIYVIDGLPSPAPYDGPIPKEYGPNVICTPEWRGLNRERHEANAHLIAAAPDLYAALEEMLSAMEAHSLAYPALAKGYTVDAMRIARAALAKARGEA